MQTSVEPLEGNKVKLTVEVDEEELRRDEDDTLRRLSREVVLPGFRPGKVPRKLLESRLGPKAVREEVLREVVPRYYGEAVQARELDVIAEPEVEVTAGEEGGPVAFDAVVEVRPEVSVIGYEGLVVTVPNPEMVPGDVDAQIDRLRDQFATLVDVERQIHDGDVVTLDIHGTRGDEAVAGLSADDFVYQVGSEGIAPGVDELLVGAKAADVLELDAEDAPGGPAKLRLLVKQVREKVLPEADDEFASDASEFDTLAELRADLETRVGERKRLQATLGLREGAIESLIELVAEDPPEVLVVHETEHLLQDMAGRLGAQQISLEDYLGAVGQSPEELIGELRTQAVKQVKADLALRALASAEGIEVDELDLDEELVRLASQGGSSPALLREALERDGRLAELRSQLRKAKALTWLVEHVDVVDEEGKPVDRSALLSEAEGPSGDPAVDASAVDAPAEVQE